MAGVGPAYRYDADGLLTNVGAMTMTRDAQSGFHIGSSLGGVSETQAFNGYGELDARTASFSASSVYSVVHAYDPLGRITQRVEGVLGETQTWAYAYDAAGRLFEVRTNGSLRARYQYDGNGNRTSGWIMGTTLVGLHNDQDQLTNSGGVAHQYDANGTLTNVSSGTSYRYDTRGSLLGVTIGSQAYAYAVDPLGRRVAKYVNGVFQRGWIYQSFLRPAAEVNASSQVVSRFVYGTRVNVPEYMVRTGTTYRLVTDHLGSVRLVIDAQSGAVAQRLDYDEWGNVTRDTNPGFQPFGFAGGLYDPDTKLVRFGYRDYDAVSGRWLAKDPILFAGGQANLYGYVDGDPVNYVDPDGEVAQCLIGAGLGLLSEAAFQYLEHGWDFENWSAKDLALGAGQGALGLGALKNAGKAWKAWKKIDKWTGHAVPMYYDDALIEGGKAIGKGGAGAIINQFKDRNCDEPPEDDPPTDK